MCGYVDALRTTISLDDDVLELARAIAAAEHKTLGQVISELVRRGLQPRSSREVTPGFPRFRVPPGAPPITNDTVARALDEGP